MSKLTWDQDGERLFETGVEQCVLYSKATGATPYPTGVAWNGITAINENPSGAEATKLYADDRVYLNLISNEEFGCTVEAYTYPDEFAECDGSAHVSAVGGGVVSGLSLGQQKRKPFGLSYFTKIGNDEAGSDFGWKIHLVYGCKAAPASKSYATVNDSPEAITFSWEVSTEPVDVGGGFKPLAHLEIDTTKFEGGLNNELIVALIKKLQGSDDVNYVLTTAAPADWATSYTSYYTRTGTDPNYTYTPVTGGSAPTWEANTYYERVSGNAYLPLPSEVITTLGGTLANG